MEKLILNKNDTDNIVKYKRKGICVIKNYISTIKYHIMNKSLIIY